MDEFPCFTRTTINFAFNGIIIVVPDDSWSARKNLDDEDMISVLDRCFTVLHGRRNSILVSAATTNSTVSSGTTNNRQASSDILSKQMKR